MSSSQSALRRLPVAAALALVMALAAGACLHNRVSPAYVVSDPAGELIVAENVVRHGRLDLDNLSPRVERKLGWRVGTPVGSSAHSHYYWFPFGTPLLSTPVVAVANLFHVGMWDHEAETERWMCAALAALTILVLYRLGRLFVPPAESVVLGAAMWSGTSWASTGATALWSQDYATLFAGLAIWLALRDPALPRWGPRVAVGTCLFLAYLCRPTLALLSPALLATIASRNWRSATAVTAAVVAWLTLFFAFNFREFGVALPLFYASDRLGVGAPLLGILCNVLSPSRGLFVFSSFLVLPVIAAPLLWSDRRRAVLLVGLAWPVAHVCAVANTDHWWAGHCFGARYTMEVLPGLFVLLCWAWSVIRATPHAAWFAPALAVTAAFSIWINTSQGLGNDATVAWNGVADIDRNPFLVFDWSHPQFLATDVSDAALRTYVQGLPGMS